MPSAAAFTEDRPILLAYLTANCPHRSSLARCGHSPRSTGSSHRPDQSSVYFFSLSSDCEMMLGRGT